MLTDIDKHVKENTFEYFEKTLITENGFREYDVRWLVGQEINANGYLTLGCAYGTMMTRDMDEDTVVVGYDYRSYSQELSRSLIVGLLSTGVRVIDIGLALSPMVYYAQHHFNAKAGLMVTASHNENGWTGVKIANGLSSTLEPDGIQRFKEIVYGGDFVSGRGTYENFEGLFDLYKDDALQGNSLKRRMKVVVACGNGTAGRFAPSVLKELGCEVIELDCTPDWHFKKHNPNPEDMSFLRSISAATRENNADLGIGIDGDGDRIGVVDDQGNEIFSDKLGLLVARWISKRHKNRPIVIDVKSTGLFHDDAVLNANEMRVITWITGHSYIKAKVREENAIAGFEKSGHWFFKEPFGRGYDDAIVSAILLLQMLGESAKPLSAILQELPKTWQSPTLSPFCSDDVKYDVVEEITAQYKADLESGVAIGGKKIVDLITVNGVRFLLEDNSWGLLRASSNQPCLVVVGESRTSEDHLHDIVENIQQRLSKIEHVGEYDQAMPNARPPK